MKTATYAELSWPQIAELPRETLLAIPLGLDRYDLKEAARRSRGETLVVLPAIPYGLPRRDGHALGDLAVSKGLLRRVLRAAETELRRQGFKRIAFLDAHGIGRGLRSSGLNFVAARGAAPPAAPWPKDLHRRVVVVSTAHTEQHGYHLPTGTDTFIAEAIAQGVAAAAPREVVCLPTWPYGVSTHTRQFPTLDLGGRVFEDFFLGVLACLIDLGAEMILFSNSHGGNHFVPGQCRQIRRRALAHAFTATEFLHTTGRARTRSPEPKRGMGHGGELETSTFSTCSPAWWT
jgi:creatinine amidohydrolase/Fe(II)-dependent formamide hydrolase-like protein